VYDTSDPETGQIKQDKAGNATFHKYIYAMYNALWQVANHAIGATLK